MATKRFQMVLDEELDAELERHARAEGVSKAELLRRYARTCMRSLPPLHEDPLWDLVGMFDGPQERDGESVDIDEVVYGKKAPR